MDFSRKEYWSGFPFPTPGDLPDPEIKLNISVSPELAYKNYVHYVFHTSKIKMQNLLIGNVLLARPERALPPRHLDFAERRKIVTHKLKKYITK